MPLAPRSARPSRRPRGIRALAGLGATGLGLLAMAAAGCAAAATYPKVEGSVAIDSPRLSPIPELMADAIEVHRQEVAELVAAPGSPAPAPAPADGPADVTVIPFNLPPNTPFAVWREVARRVPGARPATEDDLAVVHVQQLRVRPNDAEVDVVVEPRAGRPNDIPYLATVSFDRPFFSDWRIDRVRAWRVPTDVPALTWADADPNRPAEDAGALARPEPVVEPVAEPAPAPAEAEAEAEDGGASAGPDEPPVLRGASG